MAISPVYLWFNEKNQRIIWMTPFSYGEQAIELHKPASMLQKSAHLRDQYASIALIDGVGKSLADLIETWLKEAEASEKSAIRLYLCDNLPALWQQLPLAWCHLNGQPLYQRVHVLYYVPFYPETLPITTQQPALLLNLWPKPRTGIASAPLFPYLMSLMRQPKDYHVITSKIKIELHLQQHDISQHSLLCITAHGSESEQKKPFLVDENTDWALPKQQLPALVLLLACGSETGNLVNYALDLLQQGAKTVLAPIGKLDASQVEYFIQHFLQQWHQGVSVADILFQLQQDKTQAHAALRIQLIGQGDLYQHKARHTANTANIDADVSWSTLQNTLQHNDQALITFLNQLTYRCLMQDGSLENSISQLYNAFGAVYNNPYEDDQVYQRLKKVYSQCWQITQCWLNPFLIYLSSLHDHTHITLYRRNAAQLSNITLPHENLFFYYLMHGFYRKGNYAKAMEAFVLGLNAITTDQDNQSALVKEPEYKLAALSVNIFIDMNFPTLGVSLLEHTRYCLEEAALPYEIYRTEEFTLLDQEARLMARSNNADIYANAGLKKATMKVERKRELAQQDAQDGQRELASLLSLATWLATPNSVYAETVIGLLEDVPRISEEIRHAEGNCTVLYLLRALAAWAWQQQDTTALKTVENYLPIFKEVAELKHLSDSGPIGFIMAYLSLLDNQQAQQQWPLMAAKLENDAYFFELAIFHALLNDEQESKHNYQRFSRQQQRVLRFLDKLQYRGFFADNDFYAIYKQVKDKFDAKKQQEHHMLEQLSRGECGVEVLIENGFLPF